MSCGVKRAAGKQAEERSLAPEDAPQGAGDGEDDMSMGDRGPDLALQMLGEECRPLGLAGGTEVPRLVGECQEVPAAA